MEMNNQGIHTRDKRLAAVCGLFCPACTVFIGSHEDPARLTVMAERFQKPLEEMQCDGCRSSKRCFYCESVCSMATCALARGVDFCGECAEYPCDDLKTFQAAMPHRIELWKSQERIKEAGWETWYGEMVEHFSCKKCGTINSAYDIVCRKCGSTPSCDYVGLHKNEIVQQLGRMKVSGRKQ